MTYRNPPLLEAVCDFGFGPRAKWDSRMIGLLSARFAQYPKLQEIQQIELGFDPQGVVLPSPSSSTRSRFWTATDDRLVQVGPRNLSVNRLRPYDSWEAYRTQIVQALGVYMEVTGADSVEQLGLTYVNQIEIPLDRAGDDRALTLDDYFAFRPEHSVFGMPSTESSISVVLGDPSGDEDAARYEVQLRTLPAAEPAFRFQLMLASRSSRPMLRSHDGALAWLDRTHAQIETYFEASIQEALRQLFDPEPTL